MVHRVALVLALALASTGCGDDEPSGPADASAEDGPADASSAENDDSGSVTADASASESASADDASDDGDASDDASDTTASHTSASDTADGTDTSAGGGPVELYRGDVIGGEIPGWDPDDPRPLVLLGRQGADWIATLARIGDDGALSDNIAEEIIVWGWDAAPPLLYDGPLVGGTIPNWSADDPTPVVMLGRLELDASWVATLASISPEGALGDNFADRILVWGWPPATPASPELRYVGPIDETAVLRGWDPDAPAPLVLLGRLGETWQSTLVRIAADGRLSDNIAEELRVWGW
jgi:hypothetical protein